MPSALFWPIRNVVVENVSVSWGIDENVSVWNDNTGSWYLEPGAFNILVGASSRDIRLQGTLTR